MRLCHQIDLVDQQQLLLPGPRELLQQRAGLPVEAALGVNHDAHDVGVPGARPGGFDHGAIEPALGRKYAWRIDEDELRVAFGRDATHQHARGLHLRRDNGHLGADQRVDERRLADIGRADQRDKAAAPAGGSAGRRLSHRGVPP